MGIPLSPGTLLAATLGLVAADWGSQLAGSSTVPGGPLDETAHFLTMLLVLWALGKRVPGRLWLPALIASVAIDADHIPDRLGFDFLTAGTPRPYTHSLLTIAVVLAAALLWRGRRPVLLGVGLGLAVHFWRDLAEPGSGVALLWPWSYHSFSLPHVSYVAVMAAVALIDAYRLFAQSSRAARSRIRPAGLWPPRSQTYVEPSPADSPSMVHGSRQWE